MDRHQPEHGRGQFERGFYSRERGGKRVFDGNYRGNTRKKIKRTKTFQDDDKQDRKRKRTTSTPQSKTTPNTSQTHQRQGVKDVGMEYQYRVITFAAALLSENSKVKDYAIYSNLDGIPGFDDIVLKVWFTERKSPCVYFGQIKHKKKKINWKLFKYRDAVAHIINKKHKQIKCDERKEKDSIHKIECLQDVSIDDIEFFLYSNNDLIEHQPTLINKQGTPLQCRTEIDSTYKANFPLNIYGDCYKLIASGNVDTESSLFLNKTRLFVKQPCYERILYDIVDLFKNEFSKDMAENLTRFVQKYFETPTVTNIKKDVFETELFSTRLSNFIVKPGMSVEMNADQVETWNEITAGYDVIMVDHMKNIEGNICGCLLEKVNKFFQCNLKWGELVINENGKLSKNFNMQKFEDYRKSEKEIISPVYKPDTIELLLKEMWRYNKMPLILSMNDDMSTLKKYKYLKKKFILICDVKRKYEEVKAMKFSTFASVGDIEDYEKRTNLLKIIQISLQGREPVSLGDIIGDDSNCKKALKSSDILHLIKKRKAYLETRSFEKVEFMIIHKTTTNMIDKEYEFFVVEDRISENILINCKNEHGKDNCDKYKKLIEKSPEYEKYSFCRLQESEDKLEFIEENADKVKTFLVDADKNLVCRSASGLYVPVFGNILGIDEQHYVSRNLHYPIINPEIFITKRRVVFLSGDLDSLNAEMKRKIIDDPKIEQKIFDSAGNESIFLDIRNHSDEIWEKKLGSWKACSRLYLEGAEGRLRLLRYKDCDDLISYITYNVDIISENLFFEERIASRHYTSGITLISGEAGIGKSSLLHSLSKIYDKKCFVLFYDLANYHNDFRHSKEALFDLDFIFSKYTLSESYCKQFLHAIFKYHVSQGKTILFIDSFDELLEVHKEEVLDFIKEIAKTNDRIVIASRSISKDSIIKNIEVHPLEIAKLKDIEVEKYFKNRHSSNIALQEMPQELLVNPLYIKFLIFLTEKGALNSGEIDNVDLYEKVILEKVKRYHDRVDDAEDVLEIHELIALATIFGKDWLIKYKIVKNYENLIERLNLQKIRLGIVKGFRDGHPVFMHRTVAEFLAAKWLSQNLSEDDNASNIYNKVLYECDRNFQYFFDRMICKPLLLHQAVLKRDLVLVQDTCNNDSHDIEQTDKCGRNCLHLAASYCIEQQDYVIVEVLVKNMLRRKYDFGTRDKYMKWNWFHHLKFRNPECSGKAIQSNSTAVLMAYYKFEKKHTNMHDLMEVTPKRNGRLLVFLFRMDDSAIFRGLLEKAIQEILDGLHVDYIGSFCDLIQLYYRNNPRVSIFLKVCQNLCEITKLGNIEYMSDLRVNGLTALHIACLYGHERLVKRLIQSGAAVNPRDNFNRTPLFYACIQGSSEIVSCFVNTKTVYVNLVDEFQFSPLYAAVKSSNFAVVRLLLENGANINIKHRLGVTLLHATVMSKSYKICKLLLENGINIDETNTYISAFLLAATKGYLNILRLLVNHRANIEQTDDSKNTALHLACSEGHEEIVDYLIEHSHKMIYFKNIHGLTPMDIALEKGKVSIIEILKTKRKSEMETEIVLSEEEGFEEDEGYTSLHFAKSAEEVKSQLPNDIITLTKVDAKAHNGQTPLHVACKNGYDDVVEELLLKNADVNIQDKLGQTPLHLAVQNGKVNIAKMLLEKGKDSRKGILKTKQNSGKKTETALSEEEESGVKINNTNNSTETALHIAVMRREVELTRLLVKKGANVNQRNYDGRSALHLAAKLEQTDIVEILLQKDVDINQIDYNEMTALHIAVEYQNEKIVKILLESGANIDHVGVYGNTTLHIAVECQNTDITRLLTSYGAKIFTINNYGRSPVHIAAEKENTVIQKAFLQSCIFTETSGYSNEAFLKIAVLQEDIKMTKIILKKRTDINPLSIFDVTARENNPDIVKAFAHIPVDQDATFRNESVLHLAARRDNSDMIKTLLYHGANIKNLDEFGDSVLHTAVKYENSNILQMFLKNGADVNHINSNGYSALHVALEYNFQYIADMFLRRNLNIQCDEKALFIAVKNQNLDILKMLLKYGLNLKRVKNTALNVAVETGNTYIVEFLLENGVDLNLNSSSDGSALHVAAKTQNINFVRFLLEKGIQTNLVDSSERSALHVAVEKENIQIMELLMKNGIDINLNSSIEGSVLHIAVQTENIQIIELLLKRSGIDINLNSSRGSALHVAVERENTNITRLLLENCIELNHVDSSGRSALHIAVEKKNIQIVKLLLNKDINIDLVSSSKGSALHVAVENGLFKIVKLLMRNNIDINLNSSRGSALHVAVERENTNIVRLLLETGAKLNILDSCKRSALHIAVEKKNIQIAKLLLEKDIDINLIALDKYIFIMGSALESPIGSALHIAVQCQNIPIMELLIENGIDINLRNSRRETALHTAAKKDNIDIIKLLLEKGANINLENDVKETALQIAGKWRNKDTIELLLKNGADASMKFHFENAFYTNNLEGLELLIKKGLNINHMNHMNPRLGSLLHSAIRNENIHMVAFLLRNGIDVNYVNLAKESALYFAIKIGNMDIVKLLLEYKIDLYIFTLSQESCLHIAIEVENMEIVKLLVERGLDINLASKEYRKSALHVAIEKENMDIVKFLLRNGIEVDWVWHGGEPALHLAVERNNIDIVKLLLMYGIFISTQNKIGLSALHIAVAKNNIDIINLLLYNGIDININNDFNGTALHVAVEMENMDIVKLLLKNGIDINLNSKSKGTALHIALQKDNADIAKFLFEMDLDIDIVNDCKDSALLLAVEKQNLEMVELLLQEGVSINSNDASKGSALHIAIENENMDIIELLLKNRIDMNLNDNFRGSALHVAVEMENIDVVNLLLNKDADINFNNGVKGTALHVAVEKENINIVNILLSAGTYINLNNNIRGTALHVAVEKENTEIMALLLEKGIDINLNNNSRGSVLHVAIKKSNMDVVKLLLEKGIDVNLMSDCEGSPLQVAIEEKNMETVELLLKRGIALNCVTNFKGSALHAAVKTEDMEIMKLLLNRGVDINLCTDFRGSALHDAVDRGNLEIVKLLLSNGIDVNLNTDSRGSALHTAVEKDNVSMAKLLLENKIDININSNSRGSALHVAVEKAHIDVVELLLKSNIDINLNTSSIGSALHVAAEKAQKGVVELLLKNNIDINFNTNERGSALHVAIEQNRIDIIKLLLERNIDININTNYRGSALHVAFEKGYEKIVELLLQSGIDINLNNHERGSALHVSIERASYLDISKYLLKENIDINLSRYDGTALYVAIKVYALDFANILLERGIDVNINGAYGSVLHIAVERSQIDIIKCLLEKGIDVNLNSARGSALHVAVEYHAKNMDIIKLLLETNIDINLVNNSGESALHVAVRKENIDAVKLLLRKGADINQNNCLYGTALHVAFGIGNLDIAKLLIRRGADINLTDSSGQTVSDVALENARNNTLKILSGKMLAGSV